MGQHVSVKRDVSGRFIVCDRTGVETELQAESVDELREVAAHHGWILRLTAAAKALLPGERYTAPALLSVRS